MPCALSPAARSILTGPPGTIVFRGASWSELRRRPRRAMSTPNPSSPDPDRDRRDPDKEQPGADKEPPTPERKRRDPNDPPPIGDPTPGSGQAESSTNWPDENAPTVRLPAPDDSITTTSPRRRGGQTPSRGMPPVSRDQTTQQRPEVDEHGMPLPPKAPAPARQRPVFVEPRPVSAPLDDPNHEPTLGGTTRWHRPQPTATHCCSRPVRWQACRCCSRRHRLHR